MLEKLTKLFGFVALATHAAETTLAGASNENKKDLVLSLVGGAAEAIGIGFSGNTALAAAMTGVIGATQAFVQQTAAIPAAPAPSL
ncbi:MAG: hypothetical protein ACRD3D_13120 [Terriglobia bacterium]